MAEPSLVEPPYREILTERLRLRTLRVSDAEAIFDLVSRKVVMQWTSQGPPTNLEQTERWLSARALGADVFNFVIHLRDDCASRADPDRAKIIGVSGSFHRPSVGYLTHPGTTLASEAVPLS
jgi:RimJ/RimL family protein N-acetyltransferase